MISIPRVSDIFLISIVIGVAISYSYLYLFHIIFGMIIIFSFKRFRENDFKFDLNIFTTNYIYFLPLFFSWYLISVLWSINKAYSFQYLFYIFCGMGIVLYIVLNINTEKKIKRSIKVLGGIFSIQIIFSTLESFTSFRLPISPFSDIVNFFGREPSLQPTLDSFLIPSLIQPPTGFQWNPNDLAIAMIMLTPFFLFLRKNLIKWIALTLISLIIIMTSSRSVLLSMGFLFIIYLIFYKKQIMSVFLVFSFVTIFFSQIENLKESENSQIADIANTFSAISALLSNDLLVGQSLSIRQELALNGINALYETYGFGVGGGGSIAVQERMGGVDGRITSMHNFWLEVMVDSGILFALIFYCWYLMLFRDLFKLGRYSKNYFFKYLGKSISLSLIVFIPASVSASSVIYFLPMWLLFGLAITTLEIQNKINLEEL